MSKLFSYDGVASEMSLKSEFWKDEYCTTEKNDGVWLMWRIFKEYLKQNIITAVLKSKCSFSCHLQIDKKINNVNKNGSEKRKLDSNFAYKVLVRRNLM